jgi:hypothetical protein
MAKRRGESAHAASLWHELVTDPQETVFACEQLAIHYERHARDFVRALEFAQLGLKTLQRQFGASRDPFAGARHTRQQQKFVSRLDRLQHRMKSVDAAVDAPLLAQATAATGTNSRHHAR